VADVVAADSAWQYRRGFGSLGSFPAGTLIATLRENTGTLQHIGRVTRIEIHSARSGVYQMAYRTAAGAGTVIVVPIFHPGTLGGQAGRTLLLGGIDDPIAEIPAGMRPFIQSVQAKGTAAKFGANQIMFGLHTRVGALGSLGPS
jgi:hypothetical protein